MSVARLVDFDSERVKKAVNFKLDSGENVITENEGCLGSLRNIVVL